MSRISIREQVLNLVLLLLIQLPLIHRIVLFDKAFGFFYVGFILLLPRTFSRSYLMIIGFLSGLLVDVFSNTPGIHASACVFIMFGRNFWLSIVDDDWQELTNLNVASLKRFRFFFFIFPLVFLHHFILFIVENGGFHHFGMVIARIFFSSLFSTLIIFIINLLVTTKRGRS